jgi:hypothetical protein
LRIQNQKLKIDLQLSTLNPPTAADVVQGSSEGGANEPPAGGGASPRPQGASNSKLRTQNSQLLTLNSQLLHSS